MSVTSDQAAPGGAWYGDGFVMCDRCGIAIEPAGGHLTYILHIPDGFRFYHAGQCTTGALFDAGLDPGRYVREHPFT